MGWGALLFCVLGAAAAAKLPIPRGPLLNPAQPSRVALLGLSGLGLPEDLRRNIEMLLVQSVKTMQGVRVIAPLEIQMLLESPKNADLAVCGGGPNCAQKIGKAAGADLVVFGTLASLGDNFYLNLRLVRAIGKGDVLAHVEASVTGQRDRLIGEVRLAAYHLLAPEQMRGALMIETNLGGVAVWVDGEAVGYTPLQRPVDRLVPGEHQVLLKHMGYQPLEKNLTVRAFETTRLRVDMTEAAL